VRQRRLQAGLIAALVALGVIAYFVSRGGGSNGSGTQPAAPPPRAAVQPVRLGATVVGHLSVPEQNAAVAQAGPASAMIVGGLAVGNISRPDIIVLHGAREAHHTQLPLGVHDAAAVRLGRAVYLFGGLGPNGTSGDIVRLSLSGRPPLKVGQLPRGVSSAAAATVGSSAFLVGGYNGKKASDEILAWRPGHHVRVVGRLPHPLRYPAVAALGRNIYIAGGTTPAGASHDVLAFDTVTRKLTLAARLPRPTTNAAAAAFGCCVYVIGGTQEQMGVPTRRIFAIQPGRRHVRSAGRLPQPVSDLGAVAQRRRILAIGGRTTAGPVPTIVELRARR
jgi:hypothetical protein